MAVLATRDEVEQFSRALMIIAEEISNGPHGASQSDQVHFLRMTATKMHMNWVHIGSMTSAERLTLSFIIAELTRALSAEHPFTPLVCASMRIGYDMLKKISDPRTRATFPNIFDSYTIRLPEDNALVEAIFDGEWYAVPEAASREVRGVDRE